MTELQSLLTFLCNLRYVGVSKDVARLSKQLAYIVRHNDWDQAADLVRALLLFDDSIVQGLNARRFSATFTDTFSLYPQSVLPRFLFGLTSRIFCPKTGDLLSNYSTSNIEVALCALRMVRRCSLPGFLKKADELAIKDFVSSQEALIPPEQKVCSDKESTDIANSMATVWGFLLEKFDENLTLGFPGDGVTTDMCFPYSARSVIVDTRTLRGRTREAMVEAVAKFLPDWDVNVDCNIVKCYPYNATRVGKIVAVEKSFKISRGITIEPTSLVSIASTLRETVWKCFEQWGVKRLCNVHNQKRSHDLLFRFWNDMVLRDLERGSTCFSVLRQLLYLAEADTAREMFNDSRLLYVSYEDPDDIVDGFPITRLVPISTLTMGDASCTAFLTGNLFVCAFLAIATIEFGHPVGARVDREVFLRVIQYLRDHGDELLAIVGDDVVIHKRFAAMFDYYARSQHVSINYRKSSEADSIHKETCGAWGVRSADNEVHRIYPFRAPRLSNDIVGNLSSLWAAYQRCKRSPFALELLIAYCSNFSHTLEFLNNESHVGNFLGSPVGPGQSVRTVRVKPRKTVRVPDEIGYVFGFRDCETSPRESRRVQLERGRICKYTDPARPKSTDADSQVQGNSTQHAVPPVRSRSTSGSPTRMNSAWATSLRHDGIAWLRGLELTS